jgi:pimeloyl-ACP methyl ester carboxylesterase
VIDLSRPGYPRTPLTDSNRLPDEQADLELALMDSLGIERFGVMCWSGGGPSSYRLTVKHPERLTALAALAGVSKSYEFANGVNAIEYSLLTGGLGTFSVKETIKHAPKQVVKTSVEQEGDLSKEQAKELSEYIWNDEDKREFVLAVSATIGGRKAWLANDREQFPRIGDLELQKIRTPTVLVHGAADNDVRPDQTASAAERIPGAEVISVANGTHLCAWADPASAAVQDRLVQVMGAH